MHEDLTALAEYQFVGLAMPSVTTLHEPGIQRRWKKLAGDPNGDAGDPYTGYDRFGRLEQTLWRKLGTTPQTLAHLEWGYDRGSLKTWRRDLVASSAALQDQHFTYDGLDQVIQRQRGLLNINRTSIDGTPAAQEGFRYDVIGNWKSYRKDLGGVPAIEQDRVSNLNNQITQLYPNDPTPRYPGYDANGNATELPTGEALDGPENHLVWDAWNRLRKVLDAEDDPIAEYQYDGQFRRTVSQVGGVTRHFYYNDAWRSVEERLDSSPDPSTQYVWQPGNRWELIFRDRDTTGNGTLDERRYCLKDDLDVVALCDGTGAVTERFAYGAFGRAAFLDAAFAVQPSSASGWNLLFHAEFVDAETGWTNYGFRYYSVELGRWLSRDPAEEPEFNLYCFVINDPLNEIDYVGLWGWRDVAGFVPVFGSALDSYDAFKQGNWGEGLLHAALAITEATGAGAIVKGLKVGTMAFKHAKKIKQIHKSTKNWPQMRTKLQKEGIIKKGKGHGGNQPTTDHIDIKQRYGKPHSLTNHPMNLQTDVTRSLNSRFESMNPLQRALHRPTWQKVGAAGVAAYATGLILNTEPC